LLALPFFKVTVLDYNKNWTLFLGFPLSRKDMNPLYMGDSSFSPVKIGVSPEKMLH
jgi:hypothetical protein